jgi:uncharacterized integral membrane protein (TIGR00698 family)
MQIMNQEKPEEGPDVAMEPVAKDDVEIYHYLEMDDPTTESSSDEEEIVFYIDDTDVEDPTRRENDVLEEPINTPEPPQLTRCRDHPRVKELYQSPDWWSLWIGLSSFGFAVTLVFAVSYELDDERVQYVLPQPMKWTRNPFEAWDIYNLIGIPILLIFIGSFYVISLKAMGKLEYDSAKTGEDEKKLRKYIGGFSFMALLATLAFWLGQNVWSSERGLGYAVYAIIIGMAITNSPLGDKLPWLELAAKDGEFFIKCSLVLLAVELDVLVSVGGPAFLVAWIGSPIAILAGFFLGTKMFKCTDSLAMLIAVGASWCGASAISAVAPAVSASSEDVSLAISVVSFFTVIFTFAQPYIAIAVGMPDAVAGAWIGGSVDQTGNVIVSAAIISKEATEVAGIVKMVLNAGLGVMASIIACYWSSQRTTDPDQKKKFTLVALWDKFPKFTIGFIMTSGILTGMLREIDGTVEAEALPRAVSSMNRWLFAIAFVGIGLTTNLRKMWEKAWKSGIIQVYLLANTIDILLALGLAYLFY